MHYQKQKLFLRNTPYNELSEATPLHFAVLSNEPHIVYFLLEHGFNIDEIYFNVFDPKAKGFNTPLSWAIITGNTQIVAFLIDKGADVSIAYNLPISYPLSQLSIFELGCHHHIILHMLFTRTSYRNIQSFLNSVILETAYSSSDNNTIETYKNLYDSYLYQ